MSDICEWNMFEWKSENGQKSKWVSLKKHYPFNQLGVFLCCCCCYCWRSFGCCWRICKCRIKIWIHIFALVNIDNKNSHIQISMNKNDNETKKNVHIFFRYFPLSPPLPTATPTMMKRWLHYWAVYRINTGQIARKFKHICFRIGCDVLARTRALMNMS